MRDVLISARLANRSPDEVYALLSKFADYPRYGNEVISVKMEKLDDNDLYAVDWEAKFRDGILRWTEHDRFNLDKRTIEFNQVAGDIEIFYGLWRINKDADGSFVSFAATFDLGIPSLSDFLEPVAEQVLIENIQSILEGFFGSEVVFMDNAKDSEGVELSAAGAVVDSLYTNSTKN